ncbi:MAG: hypothetical protein KZQ99_10475 [Candidatus Thiodiazotropha sp. (ex Dulcina madagascariensis)]|nr:hypothetical protein [Candidatus Thiodiazotropha sp. (ex Epidulcina cf. delphinae)]MCU7923693.1 hypothetical protein [Candidatus Thiodiazotropha sp. (ex Dulcina madagascariensis)]MCU7926948.1 hypothetical protein [Candidatus Thiodiazotropha sp. (ex Dulcina madagascariensis)]MCU7935292.1 hypothetical protein [Candidatus Thiodiazotropha sp. (ex Dulcina madagascariensis)]
MPHPKCPSDDEIHQAIQAAQGLVGKARPGDVLGRTLLYLHHRNQRLEQIADLLERYLRFGQPDNEHSQLVQLMEGLREEGREEKSEDIGDFGLE